MNDIEIKRETINEVIKIIENRINYIQKDIRNSNSYEHLHMKHGIETELIILKIQLERFKESLLIKELFL